MSRFELQFLAGDKAAWEPRLFDTLDEAKRFADQVLPGVQWKGLNDSLVTQAKHFLSLWLGFYTDVSGVYAVKISEVKDV